MATEIVMPDLGTAVDYVKIVRWLKAEGEAVRRGEPICEIETDKATVEMESFAEGVLLRRVAQEGEEVQQGAIIAYLGQPGETAPTGSGPASPAAQAAEVRLVEKTAPSGEVEVSPLVRNLARREGVDLSKVRGTGPAGRIMREDVLRAKSAGAAPAKGETRPAPAAPGFSARQRAVAQRVAQSHRQIVPLNLIGRIEMSAAQRLRQGTPNATDRVWGSQSLVAGGRKVSFDAIFLYAVSRVIRNFPRFSMYMEGEEPARHEKVDLGLAVSFGEDLFTPTVADADTKSLAEIDAQVRSLVEKARAGKLSPAEMSAACFTVSNLGMYPVQLFNVIVPPGQAAALAVGTIEETFLLSGGHVRSAPAASVTLSVDHRLINGREAAEFLAALKEFIEKL